AEFLQVDKKGLGLDRRLPVLDFGGVLDIHTESYETAAGYGVEPLSEHSMVVDLYRRLRSRPTRQYPSGFQRFQAEMRGLARPALLIDRSHGHTPCSWRPVSPRRIPGLPWRNENRSKSIAAGSGRTRPSGDARGPMQKKKVAERFARLPERRKSDGGKRYSAL